MRGTISAIWQFGYWRAKTKRKKRPSRHALESVSACNKVQPASCAGFKCRSLASVHPSSSSKLAAVQTTSAHPTAFQHRPRGRLQQLDSQGRASRPRCAANGFGWSSQQSCLGASVGTMVTRLSHTEPARKVFCAVYFQYVFLVQFRILMDRICTRSKGPDSCTDVSERRPRCTRPGTSGDPAAHHDVNLLVLGPDELVGTETGAHRTADPDPDHRWNHASNMPLPNSAQLSKLSKLSKACVRVCVSKGCPKQYRCGILRYRTLELVPRRHTR